MTAPPHRTRDVLRTTTRHLCLDGTPDALWHAVQDLVASLGPTRVVAAVPARFLVHAVGSVSADDPDAWLSWTFEARPPYGTRVTLCHSEQDDGASDPELDQVLRQLVATSVSPVPGEEAS